MFGTLLTKILGFYPIRRTLAWPLRRQIHKFERATQRTREVQEALLRDILAYHADTAFGRDHGFRHAHTVADFRKLLPVAGYERIEPYINRVRRGEIHAIESLLLR